MKSTLFIKVGTCLGIVWELFGNCLELSKSDNQGFIVENGNKCGTCLGIVWEVLGECWGIGREKGGGLMKCIKNI